MTQIKKHNLEHLNPIFGDSLEQFLHWVRTFFYLQILSFFSSTFQALNKILYKRICDSNKIFIPPESKEKEQS